MSAIDSFSAPGLALVVQVGGVVDHAVRELVGGRVQRVAGAGREVDLVAVPEGAAARDARDVAEVHGADDRRAVAVVGVVAEGVQVVVVDAAQVRVGLVGLLAADRVVAVPARRVVAAVVGAVRVVDLADRVARVLVGVVGVPGGVGLRVPQSVPLKIVQTAWLTARPTALSRLSTNRTPKTIATTASAPA